jgi:hypothetical protein
LHLVLYGQALHMIQRHSLLHCEISIGRAGQRTQSHAMKTMAESGHIPSSGDSSAGLEEASTALVLVGAHELQFVIHLPGLRMVSQRW